MNMWFNLNWKFYNLRESKDWTARFPLGPVHFDVADRREDEIVALDIPAPDLPAFLESKGWLKRW